MTHKNVITFPTTRADRKVGQNQTAGAALPCVIDLTKRRNDAANKSGAQRGEHALTAGEIWEALNDGRVQLHYQPQYEMATGSTVAAEALLRLIDENGNLVYPDRFIDMVEDSDLIVPLGRKVIEHACADLADCRARGINLQRVAINVAARQFNVDDGLINFIDQMVKTYGLEYSDLEFELTERQGLTPQCAGLDAINALAVRGGRIVIDDFGMGYSSVVYLTQLPISAFKLDRALVSRLPDDEAMQSVVQSLLSLAGHLNLEVVAEGIESSEQNACLARLGCEYAQGYGYAKPMNIDDFRSFITAGVRASQDDHLLF